jgi:hypothetical protein
MKLEIPDDDLDLVIKALDHFHAYMVARNAEARRYRDLADQLSGSLRSGNQRRNRRSTRSDGLDSGCTLLTLVAISPRC